MLETNFLIVHEANGNGANRRSRALLQRDVAHMDTDPIRIDKLIDLAAEAARRAAPGPLKRYARAADISVSRASRHLNGDDPYSPPARMFALVDALARSDWGNAIPLISEQLRIVMAALIDEPDERLHQRLSECQRKGIEIDAEIRTAEHTAYAAAGAMRAALEDVDRARMKRIENDMLMSAIRTVQAERSERDR